MAARACHILEYEAQELLRADGYRTQVLPKNNARNALPLCIIAFRPPGETRYVRVLTVDRKDPGPEDVERCCGKEIILYRTILARVPVDPELHCEIWLSAPKTGLHCFEITPGSIVPIPVPNPPGAGSLAGRIRCPLLARGRP